MHELKTVLFDFDGTLVDTNELIHQSFIHTFAAYGLKYTDEELLQFNGPPLIETFEAINKELANDMIATYQKHNLEKHQQFIKLFPYVKETLDELQRAGIQLGIVSTKMRNAVELGLEITGIDHYFKSIITLNDVVHAKPHPEPVEKGMQQLHGEKDTTLMVGDNFHDILSGNQAGVQTAGVAWSVKGEEFLRTYEPNYMLQDMRDLLTIIGV